MMQHEVESKAAPILPEADHEEASGWLEVTSEPVRSDGGDWPLRALSSIHGISRVLRRLHHALEPQERQALAEAVECLSDEMLEKGCCA